MAKQKTVLYLGVDGVGENARDAKKDAERRIEAAMLGSYKPRILSVHGLRAILYREPLLGWCYSLLFDETLGGSTVSYTGNEREIEQVARFHLSQNAWSRNIADDNQFLTATGLDEKRAKELRSWIMWQRRYVEAEQRGLDPDTCRAYANTPYVAYGRIASLDEWVAANVR